MTKPRSARDPATLCTLRDQAAIAVARRQPDIPRQHAAALLFRAEGDQWRCAMLCRKADRRTQPFGEIKRHGPREYIVHTHSPQLPDSAHPSLDAAVAALANSAQAHGWTPAPWRTAQPRA